MLLASPAIAGADEPVLNMDWLASGDPSTPISFNPADVGDHVPGDDGSTIFTGSLLGDTWDLAWTTRARSDASGSYLDGVLSIINLSTTDDQSFSLETTLDVPNPFGDTALFDLAASIAVTNLQWTGGASLGTTGDAPIIEGRADSATIASLFEPAYALEALGPFGSAVDSAAMQALADPMATIGLLTSFTLSPGDLVTMTYVLEVSPVPAPGAIALLLLAAASGRTRRRRAPAQDENAP